MSNYHEVIQWHQRRDPIMKDVMNESESTTDAKTSEASYNRKYVTQKLNHGLHRIWKVTFWRNLSYVCTLRLIGPISCPGECDLMHESTTSFSLMNTFCYRRTYITCTKIRNRPD